MSTDPAAKLLAQMHAPLTPDEIRALNAALVAAKAAGYRSAADNAAGLVLEHGADADAEMILVFLERGAELREQMANQQTLQG